MPFFISKPGQCNVVTMTSEEQVTSSECYHKALLIVQANPNVVTVCIHRIMFWLQCCCFMIMHCPLISRIITTKQHFLHSIHIYNLATYIVFENLKEYLQISKRIWFCSIERRYCLDFIMVSANKTDFLLFLCLHHRTLQSKIWWRSKASILTFESKDSHNIVFPRCLSHFIFRWKRFEALRLQYSKKSYFTVWVLNRSSGSQRWNSSNVTLQHVTCQSNTPQ